jgi:hypothetical protein
VIAGSDTASKMLMVCGALKNRSGRGYPSLLLWPVRHLDGLELGLGWKRPGWLSIVTDMIGPGLGGRDGGEQE